MLARQYIRENPEAVRIAVKNRNMGDGSIVDKFLEIDTQKFVVNNKF